MVSNDEVIKDFQYKIDPKTSAPRQKLSEVLDYMLCYKKLNSSDDCDYFVYNIAAFMDYKCGIYEVLGEMITKIDKIYKTIQDPNQRNKALTERTPQQISNNLIFLNIAIAIIVGVILAIIGIVIKLKTGWIILLLFIGALVGGVTCFIIIKCLYKKPSASLLLKFHNLLNKITEKIGESQEEKSIKKLDDLFVDQWNIMIVEINQNNANVEITGRYISELSNYCSNLEMMDNQHYSFYSKLFVEFQKIISQIQIKASQNYIKKEEFDQLTEEFKQQIKQITEQVNDEDTKKFLE